MNISPEWFLDILRRRPDKFYDNIYEYTYLWRIFDFFRFISKDLALL